MLRPSRNGYFYVQDRRTGRVLSAKPYSYINVYKGVDLKTGKLIPAPEMEPKEGVVLRNICPAAPGAKDWNPSAFSPVTGLVYIPHINLCQDMGVSNANYIAGTPFVGADVKMYAGPGGNRGVFTAWDPVARSFASAGLGIRSTGCHPAGAGARHLRRRLGAAVQAVEGRPAAVVAVRCRLGGADAVARFAAPPGG